MNHLTRSSVWAKAKDHPILPMAKVDEYGHTMLWHHYGSADSQFGWEIDHHPVPKALGGSDNLPNLRALNCRQNRSNGSALGNALKDISAMNYLTPPRGIFGNPVRYR